MIFEMIALIMLFTPNARPWFRSTAAVLPKVRDNPTDVRSNP
jgi:hypothetical protein